MNGLYLLIPTLIAIVLSLLIVRAGAIALAMTGMNYGRAKFQALSAFTGTGFTTREAETVVNHPSRRRIVSWLMILGHAGIVTVIITATTSFVASDLGDYPLHVAVLVGGAFAIFLIMTRTGILGQWENFIERHLGRYSALEEAAVDELLHLIEGYGLVRLTVSEESSLANQTIGASEIAHEGFLILGIERAGRWLGTPAAGDVLEPGDRLVIYGALDAMRHLGQPAQITAD